MKLVLYRRITILLRSPAWMTSRCGLKQIELNDRHVSWVIKPYYQGSDFCLDELPCCFANILRRNYQGNRRLFRTDSLQCSKKVAGERTCWCPHTLGISCHYKTLLQSKRTPTWSDPETEKRTSNTIKLDANVVFWDKIVKPFLTLLKNEGAASGLLLNSPHTCKSLTQQMASLSSAKVWEPIISSAAWGLMKLNCGGEATLESWATLWRETWWLRWRYRTFSMTSG